MFWTQFDDKTNKPGLPFHVFINISHKQSNYTLKLKKTYKIKFILTRSSKKQQCHNENDKTHCIVPGGRGIMATEVKLIRPMTHLGVLAPIILLIGASGVHSISLYGVMEHMLLVIR